MSLDFENADDAYDFLMQKIATHRCPQCGVVDKCPRKYFPELNDVEYDHICESCKHRWNTNDIVGTSHV
jgi:uncharacterized OB-fold protein